MSKSVLDMLRIKRTIKGKDVYARQAKDVAKYHGVHVNAVYASRRKQDGSEKLDKLMAFDEAVSELYGGEETGLSVRGSKEFLMELLEKVMTDGNNYIITCTKEEDDE